MLFRSVLLPESVLFSARVPVPVFPLLTPTFYYHSSSLPPHDTYVRLTRTFYYFCFSILRIPYFSSLFNLFSVIHKHFTCSCFCSRYKHMCLSIASTFIIYIQKQTDKSVCFSQCPTVDFHNFVLFITIFFLSDVPFFSQNRSTRPEVQW